MATSAPPARSDLAALLDLYRRTGDPAAFADVYDATAPGLFRLALSLAPDPASAEDALQDTYMAALEAARRPEPVREVMPWLVGILKHKIHHVRHRATRLPDPLRLEPRILASDPPTEAARAEEAARVREALEALPEPYREVAILRWRYGVEPAAIAHARGVPPGTVRSLLSRAAGKLRAALGCIMFGYFDARPGRGLGEVRSRVLEAARLAAPGQAAAASVLLLGGALVAKKTLGVAAVLALVLLGGLYGWRRGGGEIAGPGSRDSRVEASPLPIASTPREEKGAETGTDSPTAPPPGAIPPLPATGSLLLRATWSDGTPAAEIGFLLQPAGVRSHDALRTVRTGEDGTARVDVLAPGTWYLGSDRTSSNHRAEITAGTVAAADVVLPLGVTVNGIVVDADGAPVAGASIWAMGHGPLRAGTVPTTSGPDGRFLLRGLESPREIGARAPGHSPSAATMVAAGEGAEVEVRLRLRGPGGSVIGRVLDSAGRPLAGALVRVGPPHAWSMILGEKGSEGMRISGEVFLTDAEGRFRAEGVEACRIPWIALADGWAPATGAIEVPGGGAAGLEIRMGLPGSLAGVVTTAAGTPAGNVLVGMQGREGVESLLSPRVVTAADGSFRIPDLAPGEYAFVVDGGDWGKATATQVIEEGREARWDPRLDPGFVLRGRVVDEEGRPRERWSVYVVPMEQGEHLDTWFQVQTRTDAEGNFSVAACPDRPLRVRFISPAAAQEADFPSVERSGFVAGGEPLVVTVPGSSLPSAFLVGSVLDPAGRPLAAAQVWIYPASDPTGGRCLSVLPADGSFRIGPLPPGDYALDVRVPDQDVLPLGTRTLESGRTLDLGALRFEASGRIRLLLRKAAGPLPTALDVLLSSDEGGLERRRVYGIEEGRAVLGPVRPGVYRLSIHEAAPGASVAWATVTVPAGGDGEVDVLLSPARHHRVFFPAPGGAGLPKDLRVTVKDGDGRVVHEEYAWQVIETLPGGKMRKQDLLNVLLRLPPGEYGVEARAGDGSGAAGRVRIAESGPGGETTLPLR